MTLPLVRTVLQRKGWRLIEAQPMLGGYAATLYRLRVVDEQGQAREAIYKRFDPTRTAELELYRTVLPEVPHAIPALYGIVDEDGEQGLILEAAGVAVKTVFAGEREMLHELVTLLARLHSALAEKSQQWLAEGRASAYPFESSAAWADTALAELTWLAGQERMHLHPQRVDEVRDMAAQFYPRYPEWAVGRTTYTHGDPHLENVLVQAAGQYRLIDWEWACVSLPQRDLSILLQDVLEEELHEFAYDAFQTRLVQQGFAIPDPLAFRRAFRACLFDNTLMMLGWEIGKYRNGFLTESEMERILTAKLRWLHECHRELLT
ncbi:aminoglycoside phosphotransferase family protein [Tumebacillus permanentifrigoris]|uniref:Thiamine kinase-like enzyme n=1 Tax=Tumebacillus permanentifrigoris TaxID=378543 RepID=A0A316DCK4_9BACL|nr:aminoglycoside phosphotransferase family protein [Tumebacillus permanentifrigoris]PWK14923.1 thiamine kinase-like enzyme [Tumebacillus permanentifrigoris]